MEVLKQGSGCPVPVEKQVAILYATVQGYLQDIPVAALARYEEELYRYLDENTDAVGVMEAIRVSGDLKPENEEGLKAVLSAFGEKFRG